MRFSIDIGLIISIPNIIHNLYHHAGSWTREICAFDLVPSFNHDVIVRRNQKMNHADQPGIVPKSKIFGTLTGS
jgi:hypothetical protein